MEKGLNSHQLKLIAIVAMTLDHLSWVIWPNYPTIWWIVLIHIFGRLAAPIFWFSVVEGYTHTHNLKKYIARLFVFSIIAHFAYNFAFGIPFLPFKTSVFNQTSVIWGLAWGVVALAISDNVFFTLKQWQKVAALLVIFAITFPSDWSCIGVLAILQLYYNKDNFKKQMFMMMLCVGAYALIYFLFIDKVYALVQLGVVLVIPLLQLYNGKLGKGSKWFFYCYYIGHLVLCGVIRIMLHGNMGVLIGG
ncbi:MAG: conjugal transfer protein TraX [Spirochaetales bacterium]|nr:conjugal transfer protein TraX [Spirochaetales bacterium]